MDVLVSIDALDDLLHNAKAHWLSDDVRVRPDDLAEAVERIRAGAASEAGVTAASRSAVLVRRLETIVASAQPLPIGRRVRVDREALYEVLDELRRTIPEDCRPA